ncbi:MAG: cytochrome c [Chloroflexi bacterium]|nr:cytochrome c [Chloroflexota bacterium]
MRRVASMLRRLRPRPTRAVGLAVFVLLALVVAGCTGGTYPIDIFPEMHYHQSTRIQEPPRRSPPEGAVPITGKETYFDFAVAAGVPNPLPRSETVLKDGAELFRVNCAMCHGPQAKGDGAVGDFLVKWGYSRPPNLTADLTQGRADGEIFSLITDGVLVMPQFKNMVSEDGRWSLVHYLRFLAEQSGG